MRKSHIELGRAYRRALLRTALGLVTAMPIALGTASSTAAAPAHLPERWTYTYEYTDTTTCGFPVYIQGSSTDGTSQLGNLSGGRHTNHGHETWTGPDGSLLVTYAGSLQRRDEDISGITVDADGHWTGTATATDYYQGIVFYRLSHGSQVILRDGARYTVAHTSYYVDDERVGREDVLVFVQGRPADRTTLCPHLI